MGLNPDRRGEKLVTELWYDLGLPLSLQANTGESLKLGRDHFHSQSSQSITQNYNGPVKISNVIDKLSLNN
jgi:hypothetical protein